MPSELFGQQVCWVLAVSILVAVVASLWWQWKRIPNESMAAVWAVGIVVVYCTTTYGVFKGVSGACRLILLLNVIGILAGFARNMIHRSRNGADAMLLGLLVGCFVYLMLPRLGGHGGEPTWRSHCKNNLKQIGSSIWDTEETGDFSPVTGTPQVSWRVTLLPYFEADALGAGYERTIAWNQGENLPVGRREPTPYRCPSHREETRLGDLECTDYALVTGPGTIFSNSTSSLDISQITDGASNTILAVECSGLRIPWTEPRDVDVNQIHLTIDELGPDSGSPSLASSFHSPPRRDSHGAHVLLADGSVRFLTSRIQPELLRKLSTATGNEVIDEGF